MGVPATAAVLRLTGLSKAYNGVLALDGVDLDVRPGEVHALLGGNGSGKSTLIKVLAGVVEAEPGSVLHVGDEEVDLGSWNSDRAYAAGLRFVHQQPAVFSDLSIAENIAFGTTFPTGRGGRIDWKALNARTAELLERFGVDAEPTTPLGALRAADRTRVAIIRAVQDREDASSGVLVLDEPTAALPAPEVEALLDSLRRYAEAGQTILYISHRLDEVLSVADRVTVLRDGRKVDTVEAEGLTEADLVELIVGRPLDRMFPEPTDAPEHDVVLSARGLGGGPLRDVSFDLHRGEVLGVAGLLGSGRSELLRMLFGAYPVSTGTIILGGRDVRFANPSEAMAAGMAYVPEERQLDALFQGESVRHNMTAGDARSYFSRLLFRHDQEKRDSARAVEQLPHPRRHRHPARSRPCPGATRRRSCWPGGSAASRPSCCWTSPPRASTSAPGPRSTRSSARRPAAAPRCCWWPATRRRWRTPATGSSSCAAAASRPTCVRPLEAHRLTELVNLAEEKAL